MMNRKSRVAKTTRKDFQGIASSLHNLEKRLMMIEAAIAAVVAGRQSTEVMLQNLQQASEYLTEFPNLGRSLIAATTALERAQKEVERKKRRCL